MEEDGLFMNDYEEVKVERKEESQETKTIREEVKGERREIRKEIKQKLNKEENKNSRKRKNKDEETKGWIDMHAKYSHQQGVILEEELPTEVYQID